MPFENDFIDHFVTTLQLDRPVVELLAEQAQARCDASPRISLHDNFSMRALIARISEQPANLAHMHRTALDGIERATKLQGTGDPATLAALFRDDGYISGELRQTLLTPQDGVCADFLQFEFAAMLVVNKAVPLAARKFLQENVPLTLVARLADRQRKRAYKPLFPEEPLIALDHLRRMKTALPDLAQAVAGSNRPGLVTLLDVLGQRSFAMFDQIVADARAAIAARDQVVAKLFPPRP